MKRTEKIKSVIINEDTHTRLKKLADEERSKIFLIIEKMLEEYLIRKENKK